MTQQATKTSPTNDETPHSDSFLFRRIRNWIRDETNTSQLSTELAQAVAPLLRDLKARKILLTFAPANSYDRHDTGRSSCFQNEKSTHTIELHLQRSLKLGDNLRAISDAELGFAAIDVLTFYSQIYKKRLSPAYPIPALRK